MPLYPTYNTASPTPSNRNTINSIMGQSLNIRDWLLVQNLGPKYPSALSKAPTTVKIGEPITDLFNPNSPKLADIVTDGITYKNQVTFANTFKADSQVPNTATPYDIVPYVAIQKFVDFGNVNTTDYKTWGTYPNYPNSVIDQYGIFSKTSVAAYKNDNLFNNLYYDADKQIDSAQKYSEQPKPFENKDTKKGYIDANGNLIFNNQGNPSSNQTADLIGSLVTGQGVGISQNGLVSNYDVRSSLAGRVLGATGNLQDTKLGQIGGQQLLLALTNNAAFNVQESVLGGLNLKENIYSLLKGQGLAGFRPSYKITIPEGGFTRTLDAAATILGFSLPRSYMNPAGSIFQSETGEIDNITRANELLRTTGKGQLFALLENVKASRNGTSIYDDPSAEINQFRTGYVPAYLIDNEDTETLTDTEIYAYSQNGIIVDLLCTDDGSGKGNKYAIPTLNYNKKLIEKDFQDFVTKGIDNYEQTDGTLTNTVKHSWVTNEGGLVNSKYDIYHVNNAYEAKPFSDKKKNILTKTQRLFDSNGMKTLVSREGDLTVTSNQTQTANGGGISKGSAVLSSFMYNSNGRYNAVKDIEPEDVYCRAWTTYNRYVTGFDQIRANELFTSDGINAVPFRYNTENSVLEANGHVKVVPYITDNISTYKTDVKKFMFSIENLAWHDERENLPKSEQGPGDLITGKRGRIMWFPPYDISFSESSSVEWESNKFIGRGEPVYTYNNTERSGQLSFKVVVDHSSYMNTFRGEDGPDDNYIASFMAGCIDPDSIWTDKFTLTESVSTVTNEHRTKFPKPRAEKEEEPTKMQVFFPNDHANFDGKFDDYENGECLGVPIDYTTNPNGNGCGISWYRGKYTSDSYWPDSNDFGLNNGGPDAIEAELMGKKFKGFFNSVSGTTYFEALTEHLKQKCKHCNVKVVGYASDQGNDPNNAKLAKDRAKYIRDILVEKVGKNLGLTDAELDKKFVALLTKSKELQAPTTLKKTYVYEGVTKSITVKVSANGCHICPRLEKKEPRGISRKERYVPCPVDTIGCKKDRFVDIIFEFDQAAADAEIPDIPDKIEYQDTRITRKIRNKFYNENMFFEYLEKKDNFVFDKIRQKIRHFHPSFHSTTPEGLNQRLTFLLQCTRQGPTLESLGADNLAFGRPPVCILRIGDFYHTKIVIDNISFDYEPLVWDLNPEGIGVQPMIANVNMSFKFIGGESLYGPINRLQNAVSFNFFANTHVYDGRADVIKNEGGEFSLEMGKTNGYGDSIVEEEKVEDIGGLYQKDQFGNAIPLIQPNAFDDEWESPEELDTTQSDIDKLSNITLKMTGKSIGCVNTDTKEYGSKRFEGNLDLTIEVSSELSKPYTARIVMYSAKNIPFNVGDVINIGMDGVSASLSIDMPFDDFFYNDNKEHSYRYELKIDDMDDFKTPGVVKIKFKNKVLGICTND
jgi:hypothetical protein